MSNDLIKVLLDSIDPRESIHENALRSLFDNTDVYINDLTLFFSSNPSVENYEDKILFLIINFARHLYLNCSPKYFRTLVSISENAFNYCFTFFSTMPFQSGPTAATILIFLAKLPEDFLQKFCKITNVEQHITNLIIKCSSDVQKVIGLYEFLITICFSFKLNENIWNQIIISFIFNEEINKSEEIVNKGIELLSAIVCTQEINISVFDSQLFSHFDFIMNFINQRYFFYQCFSSVVKNQLDFIPEDFLIRIAQSMSNDLSSMAFMLPILYLLRVMVKKGFILYVYSNFLEILYQISISHQKKVISLDEEYDESTAALSVIELLIEHSTSSTKYESSKYPNLFHLINFQDKQNPAILETSFRLLSSFILYYGFFEDSIINDFLQQICVHLDDQHLRVREASLWALYSICAKYTYLNEMVFSQLYIRLQQFFDDDSSIAAITIEILCDFSIKNVFNSSVQIFQVFLNLLSNSFRDEFISMRLKRSLFSICSVQCDFYCEYISAICIFLQNERNNDIADFLFELIEQILLNNDIIPQETFNSLIDLITKYQISEESISALTTLFLSFGENISYDNLLIIFGNNINISKFSILRFSLAKQDLSFLRRLWDKLEGKDQIIKEINRYFRHNEDKLSLFESQFQLIFSFFDTNYFNDFLKLLTLFVSNCFDSQKWIYFGFQIMKNHQKWINENSSEKCLKSILMFFQSVASADLVSFLQMFSDPYFITLLTMAHNFANLYVDADSLFVLLRNNSNQ